MAACSPRHKLSFLVSAAGGTASLMPLLCAFPRASPNVCERGLKSLEGERTFFLGVHTGSFGHASQIHMLLPGSSHDLVRVQPFPSAERGGRSVLGTFLSTQLMFGPTEKQ